jgi:hypothetical protein
MVGVILLDTHQTIGRVVALVGVIMLGLSATLLGWTIHATGGEVRQEPSQRPD